MFNKRTYISGETKITAENMNEIQDNLVKDISITVDEDAKTIKETLTLIDNSIIESTPVDITNLIN